ncbi:MAG TPA: penicillin acylase family protein [Gemmatimonadaceae bacterium]|nr:penicillin acylase family protein [Gemmatimonadaceae bacterium]
MAALLVLGGLCFVGARGVAGLPGWGSLLEPVGGVWAVANQAELPDSAAASVPGLREQVTVIYDDRAVPHIFAASEADAYRALGYVVARDRLFQLELQTRAAAGTLTELLGPLALAADRETRELGLPDAAARKWAALDAESEAYSIVAAYADGVNAYRESLSTDEYPIEYRIQGAAPLRWEPINSVHLFNRMGYILALSSIELRRARAAARVGAAAAAALYPSESPIQEPIQPNSSSAPRISLPPLPPPGAPEYSARLSASALPRFTRTFSGIATEPPGDALGSNNWAVAPSRTAAGHALLAGDPHLELSLPSIWYEAHIVVPGRLDVYGVTIPGAPAIVIGFNRDLAWTFTNTEADVLDYWVETVNEPASPTDYRVDGESRPLTLRIESYRGRNGELLATDTLRATHRGPMRRIDGQWLSMRWTVLEPVVEVERFIAAARTWTVGGWMDAMAAYRAPAQNMLVADRSGSIGIRSTGWFPLRADNGSGAELHDGTSSLSDWTGYWRTDAYPQAVNPPHGFLASANQQPIDPAANNRYLGADWYAPWRAMRINALLRADSAVTPGDMARFQTDPGSPRADAFVPLLLESVAESASDSVRRAATLLAEWPRTYLVDDERAILFEYIMQELARRTWDELTDDGESAPRAGMPGDLALLRVLRDSASPWWDRRDTPEVEGRAEIVSASLTAALARALREHGEPEAGGWSWSGIRNANIGHLLQIPAWSARAVPVQGGPSTLSPLSGSGGFGPSWRMVVELGPQVRAWGIYPGGQSGNPASSRYHDRIPRWSAGTLDTLRTPLAPEALAPANVLSRLTLTPGSP